MTTQEAADALGISVRRVQKLIKDERIAATKHGRDFWIEPEALDAVRERKNGRPRK